MLKHGALQQLRRTAARLHCPPAVCVSLPLRPQQLHHNQGAERLVCLSSAAQAGRAGEPRVSSTAPAAHNSAPTLLPVTVLSGFLGAGKTTLLRHVLGSDHGLRIAVLVNDLADVNIDQRLVAAVAANTQGSSVSASGASTDQSLVSLSNGCICCTIQEDLIREVRALAEQRAFDYLLVESTGVSLPLPVAAAFALSGDAGAPSMSDVARLDTLVTVVDAQRFVGDVMAAASLEEVGQAVDEEDDRTVADLLVEQVECADVLVLNKSDLVTEQELLQLQELLAKLNPAAKVISTQHGRVHPSELLSTGRFSMENVQTAPGWLQQITAFEQEQEQLQQQGASTSTSRQSRSNQSDASSSGAHQNAIGSSMQLESSTMALRDHTSQHAHDSATTTSNSREQTHGHSYDRHEPSCSDPSHQHHHHHHASRGSSAHGISSFVYYARRPFHPQRLMEHALAAQWQGVLRSKGFFWVASRHDVMGLWQSAGGAWQGEPSAIWSAALPPSERPADLDTSNWDPKWGDRCQELVWIGINMDEGALKAMLDQCLLTDEEMQLGPDGWAQFEDPLPQWLAGDEAEGEE